MSLLKLLSAGKSLDGSKSTPSPYRMRTGNLLPKFGSPKNPFATLPKTEPVKPEPELKSAPGPMETDSLFETEAKPVAAPVVRKAPVVKEIQPVVVPEAKPEPKPVTVSAAPVEKAAKPSVLAGLVKKLNPLAYLPKRQPAPRGARPRGGRTTPVQGEFSLEKVRVLRNDLNDSDLEFICAKPVVNTGTAGTLTPASPRPALTAWGRLTSRMIGSIETQTQ